MPIHSTTYGRYDRYFVAIAEDGVWLGKLLVDGVEEPASVPAKGRILGDQVFPDHTDRCAWIRLYGHFWPANDIAVGRKQSNVYGNH